MEPVNESAFNHLRRLNFTNFNKSRHHFPDPNGIHLGNYESKVSPSDMEATPLYSQALLVLDSLNAWYMPFVIYLGLVGNLLSLATFVSTHLRTRAASFYMASLAASDAGFLFVLSFVWLQERGANVYQPGLCQLLVFLSSAFGCWSVWLTVSYTAERLVAVRRPLWRMQQGCSACLRPRTVVMATALFSFCFSSPLLFFVRLYRETSNFSECILDPEYGTVLHYINILDTVLTLIVPLLLITTMNAMISRSVYLYYHRHNRENGAKVFGDTMSAKRGPGGSEAEENTTAVSGGVLSQAAQISVTRMLLVVSTAFVLLNLPSYVMRIYVFVLSFRDSEEATGSLPYILQRYFMLLYYTSFATNFILYNASSQIFRIALKGYVRSKCEFLGGAFARFSFRSRSTSSSCRKEIMV
ncbi:uncharacterized protein LOC144141978 [Haemaphysalis longicornis]